MGKRRVKLRCDEAPLDLSAGGGSYTMMRASDCDVTEVMLNERADT